MDRTARFVQVQSRCVERHAVEADAHSFLNPLTASDFLEQIESSFPDLPARLDPSTKALSIMGLFSPCSLAGVKARFLDANSKLEVPLRAGSFANQCAVDRSKKPRYISIHQSRALNQHLRSWNANQPQVQNAGLDRTRRGFSLMFLETRKDELCEVEGSVE